MEKYIGTWFLENVEIPRGMYIIYIMNTCLVFVLSMLLIFGD